MAGCRTQGDQAGVSAGDSPAAEVSETPADYCLSIRFLSDAPIDLAPDARVRVDVWGYDQMVADVSATKIKSVIVPLKSLDDSIEVPFSREDLETTKYKTGALRYYMTFMMDVDGDGQAGPEDYRWDYQKTKMMFFDAKQTGRQDIRIYLTKNSGQPTSPLE